LIFLAGHIAKLDGQPWVGQLGANLTTEQGKNAARAVAIDLMGELSATWKLSRNGVRGDRSTINTPWRRIFPTGTSEPE
jgi:hypothetical protein